MNELDQARVEELTTHLMIPVLVHLKSGPVGPERCLEALNALAAVVTLILEGAPDSERRKAESFFIEAMKVQYANKVEDN